MKDRSYEPLEKTETIAKYHFTVKRIIQSHLMIAIDHYLSQRGYMFQETLIHSQPCMKNKHLREV